MHTQLLHHVKAAALAAGEFIKYSTDTDHTDKTNQKDFVTGADIAVEEMLVKELEKAFPGAPVLSEEHSEQERQKLYQEDFTGFVIDPIDGTYNFTRGMKESAISIGYIQNGEPVAGVVFDPFRDELYWADKGAGAFCNGEPIRVSNQSQIEAASIAFSNSYDDDAMKRSLQRHLAIYDQTGHMPWTSCPGSGVLIMCWVASGRIDAFHHNGTKPWDNAAAFVIVREAGGETLTLKGEPARFTDSAILLGNAHMTKSLSEVFSKVDQALLN